MNFVRKYKKVSNEIFVSAPYHRTIWLYSSTCIYDRYFEVNRTKMTLKNKFFYLFSFSFRNITHMMRLECTIIYPDIQRQRYKLIHTERDLTQHFVKPSTFASFNIFFFFIYKFEKENTNCPLLWGNVFVPYVPIRTYIFSALLKTILHVMCECVTEPLADTMWWNK